MGLISRLKTWVTGETLNAADLNAEIDNIINTVNGNLSSANLGSSSVDTDELTAGAVTVPKLDFSGSTSDLITHAATTHNASYSPSKVIPYTEVGATYAVLIASYAGARTADENWHWGAIEIDNIPDGAIITRVDLNGTTAAGTENVVTAGLTRKALSGAETSMVSISITNGDTTSNSTSISNATLDRSTYSYKLLLQIKVKIGGTISTDASFYGYRIQYTTANFKQT